MIQSSTSTSLWPVGTTMYIGFWIWAFLTPSEGIIQALDETNVTYLMSRIRLFCLICFEHGSLLTRATSYRHCVKHAFRLCWYVNRYFLFKQTIKLLFEPPEHHPISQWVWWPQKKGPIVQFSLNYRTYAIPQSSFCLLSIVNTKRPN